MEKELFQQIYAPSIITGRGSLSFIKTLNRKRIAVICYHASVIEHVKKEAGKASDVCCIAVVEREPFWEDLDESAKSLHDFKPDLILSIGGGSVIDTAKMLHLMYEHPHIDFTQDSPFSTLPTLGKKAIHIAVPTTSGTGSEATSAAVFIDDATKTKKLFLSTTLIPKYAILDANFTDALPDSIAIMTGLDALTHAIEASIALNASSLIRSIAVMAACDIFENLHVSVSQTLPPKVRLSARENMLNASCMAGIAITNSCTGIVHSYDHPGPAFSLPHGLICGIMLPSALKLCGIQPAFLTIAKRLGLAGTDSNLFHAFVSYVNSYIQKLGNSTCFKELGIDEKAYFDNVNTWAENSLPAFATKLSPAGMTKEKGIEFYRSAYYGV